MTQQPQVASPNETEQKSPSAGNSEKKSQAAASSETDHDSATADTNSTSCMSKLLSFLIWAVIILGVIVLWLAFLHLTISSANFAWNDLAMLGQLGDSFGALNTLFSGLAFLGIIISIKLQRDDLKLQREELARQYNEMKSQRELAEEYQNERFFVLLLEQIKGNKFICKKDDISRVLDACYKDPFHSAETYQLNREKNAIQDMINLYYTSTNQVDVEKKYNLIFMSFVVKMRSRYTEFQPFLDRVEHIYEFLKSINDIKIQKKYARIAYNCIGQYDRILIFMYLVARLKLRHGDIFCDLLHGFYEIEREI